MEILKRFLCDWGSSDSNMLLFFNLISYLLGLLTGWLIWGRKIQAMLGIVAEKDTIINDINTKLTQKEADLKAANDEIALLRQKIKDHEIEKGQLRSDLSVCKDENESFKANTSTIQASAISAQVEAISKAAIVTAPKVEEVVEPKIEAPAVTETVLAATSVSLKDDLKIVEGIGPKIEELCNNIGIHTWKALSEAPITQLQEMLDAAGKRYQIHNPATWAKQAELADQGKWDELKVYQDHLKGGREPE